MCVLVLVGTRLKKIMLIQVVHIENICSFFFVTCEVKLICSNLQC